MTQYPYAARVTTASGAIVDCTSRGSSAGAALVNLRRARRGDWQRIEVGLRVAGRLDVLRQEDK